MVHRMPTLIQSDVLSHLPSDWLQAGHRAAPVTHAATMQEEQRDNFVGEAVRLHVNQQQLLKPAAWGLKHPSQT